MALMERNVPLTKSKSVVENKKLSKASTTTHLKPSGNENDISKNNQPVIKESVLINPKRTLSKCKAKIDLKSSINSEQSLFSEFPSAKRLINTFEDKISAPSNKVLSKSRTSVKLIPVQNVSFPSSSATTVPSSNTSLTKSKTSMKLANVKSDTNENSVSMPRTRSRTSMKLSSVPVISKEILVDEPTTSHKNTIVRSKAPSKLYNEASESQNKSLSKSKTSMKLKSL